MPRTNNVIARRRLDRDARRACPEVGAFDGARCPLLEQLCHPLTPSAFFKRHWRSKALAVHGGPRRFRALVRERLHNLSLPRLLHTQLAGKPAKRFRTSLKLSAQ